MMPLSQVTDFRFANRVKDKFYSYCCWAFLAGNQNSHKTLLSNKVWAEGVLFCISSRIFHTPFD